MHVGHPRHGRLETFVTTRFASTFAVTSLAAFLFALDRLVVSTALPTIGADLGVDQAALEWVVSSYTLSFAVLLLTGAALGDRFGHRRMFRVGLVGFAAGSVGAALAPNLITLAIARGVQGVGGAVFTPLALAMLSAAAPSHRRGVVLGLWGGVGGLGVALGPLVGGALTDGTGWRAIFWLNVPISLGLVLASGGRTQALPRVRSRIDLVGIVLSSAGVFGLIWDLIRLSSVSWTGPGEAAAFIGGAASLIAFVWWEGRTSTPMLALSLFRNATFVTAALAALLMYAAMFGGLFLIAQLVQVGLVATPLQAGMRLMPMAVMPMLLAPIGGLLTDRLGSRKLLVAGLLTETAGLWWLAIAARAGTSYAHIVPALVLAGTGSAIFFAPVLSSALSGIKRDQHAQASGAITAIRELAVVLGVTGLGLVFQAHGDTGSPRRFFDGFVPAMWFGGALAALGFLVVLGRARRRVPTTSLSRPGRQWDDDARDVARGTARRAAETQRGPGRREGGARAHGPGQWGARDRQDEPRADLSVRTT
jgi:EmrB/QacA subfamily drug resistance transporter